MAMQIDKTRQNTARPELASAHGCASRKYVSMVVTVYLCLLLGASRLAADEVTKWNEIAGKASFTSGLSGNPLFESRVYALTHAAIHDALNAIDRRYRPYALHVPVTPGASPEAAVATAAHHVLVNQFNRMCCKVAPPNILRRNCFLPDIEFSTLCRLGRRGEGEGNVNLQHYT